MKLSWDSGPDLNHGASCGPDLAQSMGTAARATTVIAILAAVAGPEALKGGLERS